MSRADKYTSLKKPIFYSDFLDNLDTNPVTGLLARHTNETSVKASLKRLILTLKGEREYNPYYGTNIPHDLFEFNDDETHLSMENEIRDSVANFEPRVSLEDVSITFDTYSVEIYLTFYIVNIPQLYDLSVILKRVR